MVFVLRENIGVSQTHCWTQMDLMLKNCVVQTTFPNTFSWAKSFVFRFKFHWSVQWINNQHWIWVLAWHRWTKADLVHRHMCGTQVGWFFIRFTISVELLGKSCIRCTTGQILPFDIGNYPLHRHLDVHFYIYQLMVPTVDGVDECTFLIRIKVMGFILNEVYGLQH